MSGGGALQHATVVEIDRRGVLVRGPSGSGKTQLGIELLSRCRLFDVPSALIADDYAFLSSDGETGALLAEVPDRIAGLVELRGFGVVPVGTARHAPRAALALAVVTEPLQAAGLDTSNIQQGSMWTSSSKHKVPGTVSFATPRELARFAFRIEQGRMVDEWSSLEMKKYMYLTKRRYRYAYAPELREDAVFFKSGSLYQCRPEEGFRCEKYMGNVRNMMNSVAVVEGDEEGEPFYVSTLMSNVLRFNSAWDHSRIAAAVHETLRTRTLQSLRETASPAEISEAGKSE